MTTNAIIAVVLLATVALAVLLVFMIKRWRAEEAAREADAERAKKAEEARAKSLLKDKVEAGTHLEDGRERCVLKPCPHAATHARLHFQRDEQSFDAWVRRRFGAQPRLRTVVTKKLAYCGPHHALVAARYQHRAADHEAARAAFLAREDADLADFEHGVDSELCADLEARRAASVPPPSSAPTMTKATPISAARKL